MLAGDDDPRHDMQVGVSAALAAVSNHPASGPPVTRRQMSSTTWCSVRQRTVTSLLTQNADNPGLAEEGALAHLVARS